MSILLSLQAAGAQAAEQMPDLTAVTAPTEAEINIIDLACKGGWIMIVLLILSNSFTDSRLYLYPTLVGHSTGR